MTRLLKSIEDGSVLPAGEGEFANNAVAKELTPEWQSIESAISLVDAALEGMPARASAPALFNCLAKLMVEGGGPGDDNWADTTKILRFYWDRHAE